MAVIILDRRNQNYPRVVLVSRRFLESWSLSFLFLFPSHNLGSVQHHIFLMKNMIFKKETYLSKEDY
jgi:hypothetical protein